MWGRATAALAGADLAVGAVEHQYIVTEKISGLPADLPTLRDPDARFYLKPESGALVIGGWEAADPGAVAEIPADLGPELLPPSPTGSSRSARAPRTASRSPPRLASGPG